MVSLVLLAGALTVAALIGGKLIKERSKTLIINALLVGVIKLPIPEAFSNTKSDEGSFVDELGPRLGYVGVEGVEDGSSEISLMEILISSKTTTTEAPSLSTSPLTRGMLIKILTSSTTPTPEVRQTLRAEEHDEISTEIPKELPQTTKTLNTTLVTLPSTSEEPEEIVSIETSTGPRENHETGNSMIIAERKITESTTTTRTTTTITMIHSIENTDDDILEGSGSSDLLLEEGSGIVFGKNIDSDEFLLENEYVAPLEINTEEEDFEKNYESGSGEVELIITLPQLEGSGNDGGVFEITRPRPESFSSGEDVFRALLDFLLPNKESESLPDDDNISFKQVFSSFGL